MHEQIVTLEGLETLAATFIATLKKGDVVFMQGDLGAGKTTFVRAAIQSVLGKEEFVPSPTFTLVQTYDSNPSIWHYDLYRLQDPEEVLELGMEEAFERGITFIEWAERMGCVYSPDHYTVVLQPTDQEDHRKVIITAS
jgi:tRNA threonylcarbamoyladenosine biosynthesis protein TsaE